VLASSTQALLDSDYGRSKLAAEEAVIKLYKSNGNPVAIYRLPGVFGKWCRPNYNSVVATFCYNVANALPIQVNNAQKNLKLAHIDDVVASLVGQITSRSSGLSFPLVSPEFEISIGALAAKIKSFHVSRTSLELGFVGEGFGRALYSTYISYLPKEKFSYNIPMHTDSRGVFVEFFKNREAGQFSFFTAGPGVTRGSHYHQTKTEKFVVIRGVASFGFRHMITNETHRLETCGDESIIVETIPGWAHEIINVGSEELIVMVWANEIYNRELADTIPSAV
jgi:UDP-2-acetamido-2,6-beta-L-arabino-hexul-4-ose reductase